jgi:hypothetical protein
VLFCCSLLLPLRPSLLLLIGRPFQPSFLRLQLSSRLLLPWKVKIVSRLKYTTSADLEAWEALLRTVDSRAYLLVLSFAPFPHSLSSAADFCAFTPACFAAAASAFFAFPAAFFVFSPPAFLPGMMAVSLNLSAGTVCVSLKLEQAGTRSKHCWQEGDPKCCVNDVVASHTASKSSLRYHPTMPRAKSALITCLPRDSLFSRDKIANHHSHCFM